MTKLEQARKLLEELTQLEASLHRGREWGDSLEEEVWEILKSSFPQLLRQHKALLDVVEAAKEACRADRPRVLGMLALSDAVRKWEEL